MMSRALSLWLILGLAGGLAHAAALWAIAHRRRTWLFAAAARIPMVIALLIGAALAGQLLPAVGGWAGALACASAWLVVRSGR